MRWVSLHLVRAVRRLRNEMKRAYLELGVEEGGRTFRNYFSFGNSWNGRDYVKPRYVTASIVEGTTAGEERRMRGWDMVGLQGRPVWGMVW